MKKMLLLVGWMALILMAVLLLAVVPVGAYAMAGLWGLMAGLLVYAFVSLRVTWELGESRGWSIRFCTVKGAVLLLCVVSVWLHIIRPDSFRGGMPQAASFDLELVVLLLFALEGMGVLIKALCVHMLNPLFEKLGLELF